MPVAIRGTGQTGDSPQTDGSVTINKPTGVVADDILLLAVVGYDKNTPGITPPSGFALLGAGVVGAGSPSSSTNMHVYWKRAGGSEPSTYTATEASAYYLNCMLTAWSGASTSADPTVGTYTSGASGGGSGAKTVGGVTVAENDSALILLFATYGSGTSTPSTYTAAIDDLDLTASTFYKTGVAAGATGNQSVTMAAGGSYAGVLVALSPPGGGGGPINVAVGISTETDTAIAVTKSKRRTIAATTETDAAVALTRSKRRTLGVTAETDTALAITRSKRRAIGIATETDTAVAVTRSKRRTVGVAGETDTSVTITRSKRRTIGIAVESDTAIAITQPGAITVAIGIATETDAAVALTRSKRRTIGIATETDSSVSLTRRKARTLGIATESDSAVTIARSKRLIIGICTETDLARPITRPGSITVAVGIALETDTARQIRTPRRIAIGPSVEFDTALAVALLGAIVYGYVIATIDVATVTADVDAPSATATTVERNA